MEGRMGVDIKDLVPGSVVRLGSGSPKMAVVKARVESGMVDVVWWSDRLGILEDTFPVAVLVYPRPADPNYQSEASAA
jgi:uncharacterized protein YodC (DUF2158 family)